MPRITESSAYKAVHGYVIRSNGGIPPALSIGLPIFLTFLYFLDLAFGIFVHIALHANSLFKFEMNRLSFYPLAHIGFLHLFFNAFALMSPMSRFERAHGTVYTGVILNLFAVVAGLMYCLLGSLLNASAVEGSSGWVFSFIAVMAYEESRVKPTIQITPNQTFPTLFTPVFPLILIAILVPGSSFLGHLCGLLVGYIYAFGYLSKLVPPSWIIEWIEERAEPAIQLIPSIFKYYREVDAKYLRDQDSYVSLFEPTVVSVSETTGDAEAEATTETERFPGRGNTLV